MAQKEPVFQASFQAVPNFFMLFFSYRSKPSLFNERWLPELSTSLMWHLVHEDTRLLWAFRVWVQNIVKSAQVQKVVIVL